MEPGRGLELLTCALRRPNGKSRSVLSCPVPSRFGWSEGVSARGRETGRYSPGHPGTQLLGQIAAQRFVRWMPDPPP